MAAPSGAARPLGALSKARAARARDAPARDADPLHRAEQLLLAPSRAALPDDATPPPASRRIEYDDEESSPAHGYSHVDTREMRDVLAAVAHDLARTRSDCAATADALRESEAAREELTAAVGELLDGADELRRTCSALVVERNELTAAADALRERDERLTAAVEGSMKVFSSIQENCAQTSLELTAAVAERDELRRQLADARDTLSREEERRLSAEAAATQHAAHTRSGIAHLFDSERQARLLLALRADATLQNIRFAATQDVLQKRLHAAQVRNDELAAKCPLDDDAYTPTRLRQTQRHLEAELHRTKAELSSRAAEAASAIKANEQWAHRMHAVHYTAAATELRAHEELLRARVESDAAAGFIRIAQRIALAAMGLCPSATAVPSPAVERRAPNPSPVVESAPTAVTPPPFIKMPAPFDDDPASPASPVPPPPLPRSRFAAFDVGTMTPLQARADAAAQAGAGSTRSSSAAAVEVQTDAAGDVGELQAALQRATDDGALKARDVDALRRRCDALEQVVCQCEVDKAAVLADLRRAREGADAKLAAARGEADTAKAALAEAKAVDGERAAALERRLASMTAELAAADGTIARLDKRANQATAEAEALRNDSAQRESELAAAETLCRETTAAGESLLDELHTAQRRALFLNEALRRGQLEHERAVYAAQRTTHSTRLRGSAPWAVSTT